ncbi:MAG TPA: hypothetical protein VMI30_13120 [Stellaceae bacterium]|nr:hypothetical protein [Stellaceae bacterium]
MTAPASTGSVGEQLAQLSDRLSALHDDTVAMHEDVRRMIASMLRSEHIANELLTELAHATEWLRRENRRALCT